MAFGTRHSWVAVVAAGVGVAGAAAQGVERVVIDRELRSSVVTWRGLDASGVSVVDAKGVAKVLPRASVLALVGPGGVDVGSRGAIDAIDHMDAGDEELPEGDRRRPAKGTQRLTAGVVELADGQRVVGVLWSGEAGEVVRVRHEAFGVLEWPFDAVHRVVVGTIEPQPVRDEPAADTLVFANGDTIRGVAESLGTELRFAEGTGAAKGVTLDRVRELVLATPRQELAGTAVWLGDGSVLRVKSIEVDRLGQAVLTLASGDRTGSVPMGEVRGVAFEASRVSGWMGLKQLDGGLTDKGERRAVVRALRQPLSPVGIVDFEVQGPGRVWWVLPAGAKRFAATLELPRRARVWGRPTVVIESGGREVTRAVLTPERPTAEISAEVKGDLVLRVEAGELGPAQTVVVVRRGVVGGE